MRRATYILLTILWIAIIFSFSLQPADVSSQLSSGLGKWLLETFLPNIFENIETFPKEHLELGHFLLRKCGHFSEYFILGILSMLTLFQTQLKKKPMIGFVFCSWIASVDETIQLSVSGRSGQVSDVILDSIGAAVGIMILIGIKNIYRSRLSGRKQ